jgi:hypothetical protein
VKPSGVVVCRFIDANNGKKTPDRFQRTAADVALCSLSGAVRGARSDLVQTKEAGNDRFAGNQLRITGRIFALPERIYKFWS